MHISLKHILFTILQACTATAYTYSEPLFPVYNCWDQDAIEKGLYAGAFVGALVGGQATTQDTMQERFINLLTSLGCGLSIMHISTYIVHRLCFPLGTQFLGGGSHKHTKLYYWVSACIASSLGCAAIKAVDYVRHKQRAAQESTQAPDERTLRSCLDQVTAFLCPTI